MKKLSLYVFLVLMCCNVGNALPKCEGDDYKQWANCFGTYTSERGTEYTGEFGNISGEKHGYGTAITSQGHKIVGEFKNDKPEGIVTFSHPSGAIYHGEWKDHRPNGLGTFSFPDKSIYVGEFKKWQKRWIWNLDLCRWS